MADFDPDAYLAATEPTPAATPEFDPDEYLKATAPKPKTGVEAATAYGQTIGAPSVQELAKTERQFSEEHPYLYGAAKAVASMVPTSVEQIKQMTTLPRPSQFETKDLPESQYLGEAWRGEHGPVAQAESIVGTALQALPLTGLLFPKSPLKPTPADLSLVDQLRGAQSKEATLSQTLGFEKPPEPETPLPTASELTPEVAAVNEGLAKLEQPISETTKTEPNTVPTIPAREIGYRPDPNAPKEGEYITAPDPNGLYDEVAVGWKQSHEELVKAALNKWKGSPTDVRLHLREEANGAPQPTSGGSKQTRAQAAALLYELNNNSKTTPTLYRGSGVDPKTGEPYPWSESKEVAQEFAGKNGKVYELPAGQQGLRIQDYSEKPSVFDPEKEWIVKTQPTEGAPNAIQEPVSTQPYGVRAEPQVPQETQAPAASVGGERVPEIRQGTKVPGGTQEVATTPERPEPLQDRRAYVSKRRSEGATAEQAAAELQQIQAQHDARMRELLPEGSQVKTKTGTYYRASDGVWRSVENDLQVLTNEPEGQILRVGKTQEPLPRTESRTRGETGSGPVSKEPIFDTAIKTPDGKIHTGRWAFKELDGRTVEEVSGGTVSGTPETQVGAIHTEIADVLEGHYDDADLRKSVWGYVTKSGKFLDKKQAFEHAAAIKQIDKEKYQRLRGEDLGVAPEKVKRLDSIRFEDALTETGSGPVSGSKRGTISYQEYDEPSGQWIPRNRDVVISKSTIPSDKEWRATVFAGSEDNPTAIGHVQLDKPELTPEARQELSAQLGRYTKDFQVSTDTGTQPVSEAAPKPEVEPKLLPGEKQGDLISSTQQEPFALVGEKAAPGTHPTEIAEAAARAQAAEEARLKSEYEQGLLEEVQQYRQQGGDEFLVALKDSGGLPAKSSPHQKFSGELQNIREEYYSGTRKEKIKYSDVFRKDAPDPDVVAQRMRAKGFDVSSDTDLLQMARDRIASGRPAYGSEARGTALEQASFGGIGAARAGEIPEAKAVSIRNSKVDEERMARGQPPLMGPARKAMPKTWDEAMQRIENDETVGDKMVTDILDNQKKEISEVDHAVLMHEKIRVMNQREMEAARATDPNAPEDIRAESRLKWAAAEDRINDIDHATKQAGTISGRALQFRQAVARDDYTFAGLERKMRIAKDAPLTPEESTKIKDEAAKIEEAEKKATEAESKVSDEQSGAAAESSIRKMRQDRGTKEIDRTKVLEQMRKRLADGDSPKDLGSYLQRIALSFVRAGITTREALLSAVHDFTKDITGFEPRETRDAISGYGDFKPLDKETAKVQLRGIKGEAQQISKLEDMAAGQAPLKTGIERREPTDAERALIKQVNEAKKKGGFNVTDPEKQLRSALDSVKTRLKNQISDLQTQIDTGERTVKTRTAPPTDAEVESLKVRRDELKKQFNDIFGSEISDQQRLARAKSYLTRRAAELEDQIRRDNFAPKPKLPPIALDSAATTLRNRVDQLKLQADRRRTAIELSNRPAWMKAFEQIAGTARFAALSGYHTLAKILGYTAWKGIEVPLTEGVGAITDLVPGLRDINAKANLEAGPRVKAIARYYKDFATTGMRQAAKVMTTYGESDVKSGRPNLKPTRWYDFFGVLHQAEKSIPLTAQAGMHFEKSMANAAAAGVDVLDPMVQAALRKDSVDYAQRSILQESNRFAQWVNDFNRRMKEVDKKTGEASAVRSAIATGIETLFTKGIIKTPANYVVQSLERTPLGLGVAAAKSAKVWMKGLDKLTPAEANVISRLWKTGAVGTGMFIWGALDALKDPKDRVFGGYYQPGEKREEADAHWGTIRLGSVTIPHLMSHSPLLEPAHLGNTVMRVATSRLRKKDAENRGLLAGLLSATFGLAERAPISSTAIRTSKIGDPHQQEGVVADIIGSLVPQLVANLAQDLDRRGGEVVKRKPENLLQSIELRVPGLRRNVPEKTKPSKPTIGAAPYKPPKPINP